MPRCLGLSDPGEGIEGGHTDERLSGRKRQPLHRGYADPKPGKRSRTCRDREYIDVSKLQAAVFQDRHQITWQASGRGQQ
jgi:hypothetical protein